MEKKKMNINISKDDHNINDYLYCWAELGERPNKINLYNHYKSDDFIDFVSKTKISCNGSFTDVIPTGVDYIVNEKVLVQIDQFIYVSYIHYDKLTDENIIGEVSFIFLNQSSEKVNVILSELDKLVVDINQEDANHRINTITIGQNGLEVDSIDVMIADYENIEYYFNDDIIKKANKISKSLKKTNKGLTIIHGERGVGKTTLVNYIVSNIDKIVIFIPCTMIESTINNPDFRNFIKRYKNSVIVLDDSELYFGELYSKSNIFTNNLLQLVDGFQSDDLDLNIITVLNVDDIDDVDHILFDSNNLIDIVEIGKLKKEKAQELNKFLGSKVKIKNDVKLVDVLKKRNFKVETGEIGFN
jgi:hypothetical protein